MRARLPLLVALLLHRRHLPLLPRLLLPHGGAGKAAGLATELWARSPAGGWETQGWVLLGPSLHLGSKKPGLFFRLRLVSHYREQFLAASLQPDDIPAALPGSTALRAAPYPAASSAAAAPPSTAASGPCTNKQPTGEVLPPDSEPLVGGLAADLCSCAQPSATHTPCPLCSPLSHPQTAPPAPRRRAGASAAPTGWPAPAGAPRRAGSAVLHPAQQARQQPQPARPLQRAPASTCSPQVRPACSLATICAAHCSACQCACGLAALEHHVLCLNMRMQPALPADGSTCSQKKLWGQCSAAWMAAQGWCAATCGRCSRPPAQQGPSSAACSDVAPPGAFTCAQQKAWGKVGGGRGRAGRVRAGPRQPSARTAAALSSGVAPQGGPDQAFKYPRSPHLQCSDAWIQTGGFCQATCGRCAASGTCTDSQPAGGYTCAQQAAWGKVRGRVAAVCLRPLWLVRRRAELAAP